MKQIVRILQHPILKIIVSPLAAIIFGLLASMISGANFSLNDAFLLYLITISGHLLSHYFFLRYSSANRKAASPLVILGVCELILLGSTLWYVTHHHWLINTLLLIYIIYLHLEYFPYNLSSSWFHYLLEIFFNAFVLNCIAYFTMSNALTSSFIQALIPLILLQLAIQIQTIPLRSSLMNIPVSNLFKNPSYMSVGIAVISLFLALIYSRPSRSFFLVQIIFAGLSLVIFIPLLVQTSQQKQNQRKLNYLSAIYFLFACFYGLSYIF